MRPLNSTDKSDKVDTFSVFEKPFILSMGPQRAGTSWIDRYLRSRGDVCLPADIKELYFFDRHYKRGLSFYKSHFKPATDDQLIVEVSTTSFDHPKAPQRVFETFGKDIKFICPLRHPARRSYSLYMHYRRYGLVKGSLQEACEQIPQIITSSHYAQHLKTWFQSYDPSHFTFLFQEDLRDESDLYVHTLCEALGLAYQAPTSHETDRYNQSTEPPSRRLALAAQKGGQFLRQFKLYGPIKFAKAIGLRELIFGTKAPYVTPEQKQADIDWLSDQLSEEIEKLEKLLGTTIKQWH